MAKGQSEKINNYSGDGRKKTRNKRGDKENILDQTTSRRGPTLNKKEEVSPEVEMGKLPKKNTEGNQLDRLGNKKQ